MIKCLSLSLTGKLTESACFNCTALRLSSHRYTHTHTHTHTHTCVFIHIHKDTQPHQHNVHAYTERHTNTYTHISSIHIHPQQGDSLTDKQNYVTTNT